MPRGTETAIFLRRCVRAGTAFVLVLFFSGVGVAYWPLNKISPPGSAGTISSPKAPELIYTVSNEPYRQPVKTSLVSGKRVVWMEVTAYCPCKKCCGPRAHGVTASGYRVTYNNGKFVAADLDRLPFGTRVSIPGYHNGQAVPVIDTGYAIRGNRIDVYFPSHETAMRWGVKYLPVTIEN